MNLPVLTAAILHPPHQKATLSLWLDVIISEEEIP